MALQIINQPTIVVNSLSELQAKPQFIKPGNIYFVLGSPWKVYVCLTGTTLSELISDTGSLYSAWTPFVPTVTPSAGTFTSVTLEAAYKQFGKTVLFRISLQATLTVSNATNITFDCPVAPLSMSGFQSVAGNLQLVSTPTLNFSGINDNTSKIFMLAAFTQVAMQVDISGSYEAA